MFHDICLNTDKKSKLSADQHLQKKKKLLLGHCKGQDLALQNTTPLTYTCAINIACTALPHTVCQIRATGNLQIFTYLEILKYLHLHSEIIIKYKYFARQLKTNGSNKDKQVEKQPNYFTHNLCGIQAFPLLKLGGMFTAFRIS